MPTTAKGIWTPDNTDDYDLVVDWAANANSVDAAISTYGNALKGTAAQRTAFTTTATNGMLWQDTDGIRMIWRKDGAVWVPAVWQWSGTTAQMNAFTAPTNGFRWQNTSDNLTYVRQGSSWVLPYPRQAAGVAASVGTSFVTVSLPSNRFSEPPVVVAQMVSGAGANLGSSTMVTGVTSTSFQVRLSPNTSGGNPVAAPVHWTATQMTPSSAAG